MHRDGAPGVLHLVSDGAGGCIFSWQDERISSQNPNIFAQRLDGTGAAQWGVNGTPVCNDGGVQSGPRITSDGSGGAVIFWIDQRVPPGVVFAQRVDATGTLQFAANGLNVLAMPFGGRVSEVVAAPAGNAIVLTNQLIFDFGSGTITRVLWWRKDQRRGRCAVGCGGRHGVLGRELHPVRAHGAGRLRRRDRRLERFAERHVRHLRAAAQPD